MSHAEIAAAYGAVADQYISMFGSAEHVHVDDRDLIRRHFGPLTGPILDLGCGPGHLSGYLHELGKNVTGVDLVPEFISHAARHHRDIAFSVGTLQSLTRPDHYWDGILAWYSLIHLDAVAIDGALAGLRHAIAEGGILVTGVFTGDEIAAFDHKVLTAYRWPIDEFAARLMKAGFVELERIERAADGQTRAHAAIAARAI